MVVGVGPGRQVRPARRRIIFPESGRRAGSAVLNSARTLRESSENIPQNAKNRRVVVGVMAGETDTWRLVDTVKLPGTHTIATGVIVEAPRVQLPGQRLETYFASSFVVQIIRSSIFCVGDMLWPTSRSALPPVGGNNRAFFWGATCRHDFTANNK